MKTISRLATIFSICFGMMLMVPVMAFGAPPVNDNFINAIEITGTSGQITGTNADATREAGEPSDNVDYSVWWRWTAPVSGEYVFDTTGSKFNVVLAVYTGSAIKALTCINAGISFSFSAQAGVRYYIAIFVNGGSDAPDNNVLNWRMKIPPDKGISSVYPSNGIVGKNLPITITGIGFDATTRVSMYSDSENFHVFGFRKHKSDYRIREYAGGCQCCCHIRLRSLCGR